MLAGKRPMSNGRWTDWLGLAKRAGRLAPGDSQVRRALQENRARAVVLAEDAGHSVRRRYESWASERSIPLVVLGTKMELGVAIGMGPHAVMAVTQKSLVKGLLEAIAESTGRNYLGRETGQAESGRQEREEREGSRHTRLRAGQGAEDRQSPPHRPPAPAAGRKYSQPYEHRRAGTGGNRAGHYAGEAPPDGRRGGPPGERRPGGDPRPERGRGAESRTRASDGEDRRGPGGAPGRGGRRGPADPPVRGKRAPERAGHDGAYRFRDRRPPEQPWTSADGARREPAANRRKPWPATDGRREPPADGRKPWSAADGRKSWPATDGRRGPAADERRRTPERAGERQRSPGPTAPRGGSPGWRPARPGNTRQGPAQPPRRGGRR